MKTILKYAKKAILKMWRIDWFLIQISSKFFSRILDLNKFIKQKYCVKNDLKQYFSLMSQIFSQKIEVFIKLKNI
jgi:hypothetical protein